VIEHTGKKGEETTSKSGTNFRLPKRLDHFIITTTEKDEDGDFILDMPLMEKINIRKHLISAALFALSLGADIVTKLLVVANVDLHERINVLGSFVQITLLYNRGGLFGIMQGYQSFFLIVSIVVLGLMFVYYALEENKTPLFCNSMALITSGAVGNILDRLLNKPGVVDFIYIGVDHVYRWPAFNIADASIVTGAGLLLVFYIKEERRRKKEHS